MTSIRRESANRIDALMCTRSLGLHDASYTEAPSHLLSLLTILMPVGHRSGYWQRLYQPRRKVNPAITVSSARVFTRQTDWRICFPRSFRQPIHRSVSLFSSCPDLLPEFALTS